MENEKSFIQKIPPAVSGFILGSILLTIGLLFVFSQYKVQMQSQQAEIKEDLVLIEQSFQFAIREVNSIALLLSQSVDQDGNATDFETYAKDLIEEYPSVNVLELIRNGIVTHIYPFEGYDEVLGFDLYQNERIKLELFRAAENSDIYFSGPIMLVEEELGVIGLLPFNKNGNEFDISAVIIYLDTFFNQSQMSTFADRYTFQFSKINLATGEEEFFIENPNDDEIDWSKEQFIIIPEGDWKLYAHRTADPGFSAYIIIIALFSALISVLVGYLSFQLFQKPIELERLLKERTNELYQSRNQFKQSSELLGSVLASPQNIIIYSLNQQFKYIAFNQNYKELAKEYFNVEVHQGASIYDVYPDRLLDTVTDKLNRTLKGESFDFVREIKHPSNKITYWENWFSPIRDKDGSIIGVTIFSVDITDRINSEKEKTTLLTEIHHRVKNNLAIVSGLLELQKSEVNDQRLSTIFDQSINRIISIALVHELMYSNDDLSSVDVHAYLEKLVPAISATMQNKAQNVHFSLEIEEYQLNINEAIPLGLLLNELITNSFKYAFGKGENNNICVRLRSENDRIYVKYAENGRGFPEDVDFNTPKNLGLNLVHAQLSQLEAVFVADTDNKFELEFSFTSHGKGSHSNF